VLYRPRLENVRPAARPGCLVAFGSYNKETDRFGDAVQVPAGEVMVATGEELALDRPLGRMRVLRLYSPSAGLVWAFRDYVIQIRQKKVSPQPVQVA
jgi:hypothetical protein